MELGRLRLDDDVSVLLPEFPWQGRHVTLRQLMDATGVKKDEAFFVQVAQNRTEKVPVNLPQRVPIRVF